MASCCSPAIAASPRPGRRSPPRSADSTRSTFPSTPHIPVKREAAHPRTGDATLPDDRYTRTLDPWVSLATAASATSRIGLATAVALPVESDPITLAKTIATLDLLSGARVTLGAGFGWNTEELADHGVPADSRRTVLREYLEAMRALWTQDHASFSGSFVNFGPSWAFPKPVQPHIPVIIGAGGGPATFAWITRHADGWMTTPGELDIPGKAAALRRAWDSYRTGVPDIRVLITARPSPDDLSAWASAGVTELLWGLPDAAPDAVEAYLDRLAARVARDSR